MVPIYSGISVYMLLVCCLFAFFAGILIYPYFWKYLLLFHTPWWIPMMMGLFLSQRRKEEEICSEFGVFLFCSVPRWNNGKIQISERQKSRILSFKSFLLLTWVIFRTDPLVSTEEERKKLIESIIENIKSYTRDIEGRAFFQEMLNILKNVASKCVHNV